jgi:transcriptional regulator with XRE-family HTH domain
MEEMKPSPIGNRPRVLREQKQHSKEDIEGRTSLLACYISRVECGQTVPAVQTLEKLRIPMKAIGVPG